MSDATQTLSDKDLQSVIKSVKEVAPENTLRKIVDLQEGRIRKLEADVERLTYIADNISATKTKWNYFKDPYKEAKHG